MLMLLGMCISNIMLMLLAFAHAPGIGAILSYPKDFTRHPEQIWHLVTVLLISSSCQWSLPISSIHIQHRKFPITNNVFVAPMSHSLLKTGANNFFSNGDFLCWNLIADMCRDRWGLEEFSSTVTICWGTEFPIPIYVQYKPGDLAP